MLHYLLPGWHQVWMTDYFITLEDRWVVGGGEVCYLIKGRFPLTLRWFRGISYLIRAPQVPWALLLSLPPVPALTKSSRVGSGVGEILERGQRGKTRFDQKSFDQNFDLLDQSTTVLDQAITRRAEVKQLLKTHVALNSWARFIQKQIWAWIKEGW